MSVLCRSRCTDNFTGYHWIYWVGPGLGSLLAVAFYKLVKGLEYETVNPGQDAERRDEKFAEDEERPAVRDGRYGGPGNYSRGGTGVIMVEPTNRHTPGVIV